MEVAWNYLVLILACGFGAGLTPYAPGTLGSLIGIALFLAIARLRARVYVAIVVAMFAAGIYICGAAARAG